MKLISAQVFEYKCIKDSNKVEFENVTCLVGKNESGKTTFLQALAKINPLYDNNDEFKPNTDFPKSQLHDYKTKKKNDENFRVEAIEATFNLTQEEFEKIEKKHGKGILASDKVKISKYYEDGRMYFNFDVDEKKAMDFLIKAIDLFVKDSTIYSSLNEDEKKAIDFFIKEDLLNCSDQETLKLKIGGKLDNEDDPSKKSFLKNLQTAIEECPKIIIEQLIKEIDVPKFFYFDDYSIMCGIAYINRLKGEEKVLSDKEKTFKKFLDFAGVDLGALQSKEDYEELTANLESMSNEITTQIFEYWTQNKNLSVDIRKTEPYEKDEQFTVDGDVIRVRIKNEKHKVTVPFDDRSKGFIWFFSFFIYFSQIEKREEDVILLLDEPGLNLHAKAQEDFLRFINEKLAEKHQVVYTTHSPFLIPTDAWHSVRTVEDMDDEGTKISADALKNNKDTIFPLQGALGYDLAQTLFVGKNCLIVEGPSDLIYLQLMSNLLEEKGKKTLSDRWVITPVGGADKISTFIALLKASKLNIAVLRDSEEKDRQKIDDLTKKGFFKEKNMILLSEYNDKKDADIEDLFPEDLYLQVINDCYKEKLKKDIKISDLSKESPRIVKRLKKIFKDENFNNGNFNHYKPSMYLQSNLDTYKEKIDEETLEKFEEIFKRVNGLLR